MATKYQDPELTDLYLKSAILSNLLVETFDEIEAKKGHKAKLKKTAKQYFTQLNHYITSVFKKMDSVEEKQQGGTYINQVSAQIEEYLNHLLKE